jgi:integrase
VTGPRHTRRSGGAPVSATNDDVFGVITECKRSGVPCLNRRVDRPTDALARSMFDAIPMMFTWLQRNCRIDRHPCDTVHKPEPPQPRDRVLSTAELVAFWNACGDLSEPFGPALRLLLVTGCRLNEVAGMHRSELSEDDQGRPIWTIPSIRTKNKKTHVLPMLPLACDIIANVKPIAGPYVFTTNGRSAISGWSRVKSRLDAALGFSEKWRFHDLRRSAATGMADLGIAPHIVGACLNHVSGTKAGVAGTYKRAAYAPKKRAALERWAERIERLVSREPASKVVSLRK